MLKMLNMIFDLFKLMDERSKKLILSQDGKNIIKW